MSIQGIFNTTGLKSTNDLTKLSFSSMITRLMPNGSAPLFGLTSMLGDETALAVEHGFFTKTMMFPQFALGGNISSTDTVITVADSSQLLPGQIHRIQSTGENVIINAVTSPTSITVTRGVGTVAAASALSIISKKYGLIS